MPKAIGRSGWWGVFVCGLCAATPVLAGPRGGSVAAGSATISVPGPGRTQVDQTSDRVIVNWQGFSIDKGEVVQFNQPSSSAAALNRVTGADPSQILGQLSANGRILLINPNGILFGAGSRVDVAGLIATTANLADDDFMAKRLSFTAPGRPGASVVNRGTITVAEGGLVALVAPGVANEGVINARLGRVSLVSANRFTVDFAGDRLIQFAVDDKVVERAKAADGTPLSAAVTNSGRIAADGGVVQLSANVARGIVDRTIDMTGIVEARAVRQVGGKIRLEGGDGTVQVSGRLDASGRGAGQTGGRVTITGERVGLFAGSSVDASGDAGGGTVLVGGNRLGQGPERNAVATYVDREASVKADAVTSGNGGQIVVWSDGYTRFDGSISARGGAAGGNGGAVETSSKNNLSVGTGRVDAAAPAGKAGEWLLDPSNVDITNNSANGSFDGGSPNAYTPAGNNANVDSATISASLSAGTNVTITTASGSGQPGNLRFQNNGSIAKTGNTTATLTLNVDGNVTTVGSPTITTAAGGALSVVVNATSGAVDLPDMSLQTGNVTVNAGGAITQSGAIVANQGSFSAGGNAITLTNTGNALSGAVTLTNSGANDVQFTNTTATILGTSTIGRNLTLVSGGAVTQTGVLTVGGTTSLSATAANTDITLNTQANSLAGAVSFAGTQSNIRDFLLRNVNAAATVPTLSGLTGLRTLSLQFNNAGMTLGAFSASGTATAIAGGAITQSAALTVGGASFFTALGNPITLTQAGNSFGGAVTLTNSGTNDVQLTNGVATALGTATVGRNLTVISTSGAITQTGAATVGGTSSFSAGANPITLTQTNAFTGAVSLSNSGANGVQLVNGSATVLGSSTVGQNLSITSGGAVTQSGALTVPGTTTLTATAASTDIALDTQANNLTGAVSIGGTAANVRDLGLRNTNAAAALPALGGLTGLRNLTLAFDNAGITLPALTPSGSVSLTAGGTVALSALTAGGGLTVTAPSTTLATTIVTGGAISITGGLALGGASTLRTTGASAAGASITLAGAVTGTGQDLTLNAGTGGDISLQTVGSAGARLGALTIANARDLTASGLVAGASFTQSAGTGTTRFNGSGLSTTGTARLTTGAVSGTVNVGSFAVTTGSTVVTGSINGVGGTAAAALATAPGSTGTQTVNGCTIGSSTCTTTAPASTPAATPAPAAVGSPASSTPVVDPPDDPVSVEQTVVATGASRQVVTAVSGRAAPPQDANSSNVGGFVVSVPTQNVDWSNPSGDLAVTLAPEFGILDPFFHGGQASR